MSTDDTWEDMVTMAADDSASRDRVPYIRAMLNEYGDYLRDDLEVRTLRSIQARNLETFIDQLNRPLGDG